MVVVYHRTECLPVTQPRVQEEAGSPAELVSKIARGAGTVAWIIASESKATSGGGAGLVRAKIKFAYDKKIDTGVIPTPFDVGASDIKG